MSAFGGVYITNKGIALQAKAQAGATLNFTRIAMGSGDLAGQQIVNLTDLITEEKSLSITKLKPLQTGEALVGASFTNADIVTGFTYRELGVFAQDPDEGEILYCYGNAGVNGEYIPPGSGGGPDILERHIDVITVVGSAPTVTATIDDSLVYVTVQDFDAAVGNMSTVPTTNKTASGAITELHTMISNINPEPADGSISDTKIGNRTVTDSTAPSGTSGTLTTLLRWIAYMIKAITGKSSWITSPAITLEATKNHVDAAGAHGATSSATANRMVLRDASGRAQVAAPAAASDIARKAEVDAHVNKSSAAHAATAISATGGTNVQAEIDGLKSSVSNGKDAVAAAITDMNQSASGSDTFAQHAAKIRDISKDANATTAQVLLNRTFYQGGAKRTGTMPDRSGDTAAVSSAVSGTTLRLRASEGYRDGTNDYVTITDGDFVAGNIRDGVNLFGKFGTMVEGKKYATGVARSSGTEGNPRFPVTVTGLDFLPRIVMLYSPTSGSGGEWTIANTDVSDSNHQVLTVIGTSVNRYPINTGYISMIQGSFSLPGRYGNTDYTYWAFE